MENGLTELDESRCSVVIKIREIGDIKKITNNFIA